MDMTIVTYSLGTDFDEAADLVITLSPREQRVLSLLPHCNGNKAIAEALGLSPLTIKSHLARISRRLLTGDRARMAALIGVHESRHSEAREFFEQAHLTQRQWQIVYLIARGLTNAEIANELFLTVNTVKTHMRHMSRQLGVQRRETIAYWYGCLIGPTDGIVTTRWPRDSGETRFRINNLSDEELTKAFREAVAALAVQPALSNGVSDCHQVLWWILKRDYQKYRPLLESSCNLPELWLMRFEYLDKEKREICNWFSTGLDYAGVAQTMQTKPELVKITLATICKFLGVTELQLKVISMIVESQED